MIDRFLKAKHWQLFLLIYGLPTILHPILIGLAVSIPNSVSSSSDSEFRFYTLLNIILILLFSGILGGWFWSVAIGLQKKIPEHVLTYKKRFKVSITVLAINSLLIFTILSFFMLDWIDQAFFGEAKLRSVIINLLITFEALAVFCFFYVIYFIAKTLKTIELQRAVKFQECIPDFFLVLFYPIGIWVVQPYINELVEEENTSPDSDK